LKEEKSQRIKRGRPRIFSKETKRKVPKLNFLKAINFGFGKEPEDFDITIKGKFCKTLEKGD